MSLKFVDFMENLEKNDVHILDSRYRIFDVVIDHDLHLSIR